MIDDQYIIDRFFKENNINKKTVYNLNEEELQYLKNRFNDSSCLNETFWRIKLKLYKRPTCEYCGGSLKYQYHKGRFSKTCENIKCKSNNILNQLENNFSDKEVININDNTILEKYKKYILNHKTLNYLKTIYSKKEWDYILNRYKDYDSIKEIFFRIENNIEIRPTCKLCGKRVKFQYISRYKSYNYNTYCSCKCTMNDKDFIEKIENSMIKKYGVKNIQFLEETKIKTKNTNLKRYGVEYQAQRKEVIDKFKITNKEKYGYEFPLQNPVNKEKISKHNSSKEFQKYQLFIKKKNGTIHTSSLENYLKTELIRIFGDNNIKCQFRSELYPWNCDFYIIPLNLYIEIQGTWTHGFHPFNSNNKDDVLQVELMKSKNTKYYDSAIDTWTIRDVEKRNTAKKNNINYIELWNRKDCENFINRFHLKL